MDRLSRRAVLVTEAASGIGRAGAVAFARVGASLALLDVDEWETLLTAAVPRLSARLRTGHPGAGSSEQAE